MWRRISKAINRSRLTDPQYTGLFEPYTGVEAISFDLETTGLDSRSCEILSIGAVKIRGNQILASQKLDLIVQPTGAIDKEAIKTHHLRHVDVANGLKPRQALHRLLHFIGPRPLVGYYLEFDVAVVNRYLKPWLGIRLPNKQIEVSALYYDKMTKGRTAGDIDLQFDTILSALELPELPKHDAVNDALMSGLMYIKLNRATVGG